jgi:hypothetical protein
MFFLFYVQEAILSVRSSSCAAVVNICGGNCGGPPVGWGPAGPRAFWGNCWFCWGVRCAGAGLSRDKRSMVSVWVLGLDWRGRRKSKSRGEGGGTIGRKRQRRSKRKSVLERDRYFDVGGSHSIQLFSKQARWRIEVKAVIKGGEFVLFARLYQMILEIHLLIFHQIDENNTLAF